MDFINTSVVRRCSAMSYKFQRLREKIRRAVQSGELAGKLPGERELAKRFRVNAKTLSKALTDLAAEGLLRRSIGRGTFVAGNDPSTIQTQQGRWLLLIDPQADHAVLQNLIDANPRSQSCDDPAALRPSFLNQFSAVIDLAASTSESFIRDLLVRNIAVVRVGHEPRVYSTHAVLLDMQMGVAQLVRQLALGGHRRFLAVEAPHRNDLAQLIRRMLANFGPDCCVDACSVHAMPSAVGQGATAVICASTALAQQAMAALASADLSVPDQLSVAAIGFDDGQAGCTGWYVPASQAAAAVKDIRRDGQNVRPITLWLAGRIYDHDTTAAPQSAAPPSPMMTALIA